MAEIQQRIDDEIDLLAGCTVVFGGQFENQQHAQERLIIVVSVSLGAIFFLLCFAFATGINNCRYHCAGLNPYVNEPVCILRFTTKYSKCN